MYVTEIKLKTRPYNSQFFSHIECVLEWIAKMFNLDLRLKNTLVKRSLNVSII